MNRKPVESSNIVSIGHEDKVLEVEFLNGSIYQYKPITEAGYKALLEADSIGSFFYKNIRSNKMISTEKVS